MEKVEEEEEEEEEGREGVKLERVRRKGDSFSSDGQERKKKI